MHYIFRCIAFIVNNGQLFPVYFKHAYTQNAYIFITTVQAYTLTKLEQPKDKAQTF